MSGFFVLASPFARPLQKKPTYLIDRLWKPIDQFTHTASGSGIVLLVMTAIALALANTGFADDYFHLLETPLSIGAGDAVISKTILHWISDGLMAIFFFHVGLEIKRELISGELSTLKNAALPLFAALGGMIVPALIFALFNAGTPNAAGWGIPMATDIAFALGIVSLLGNRVPLSLKVFLVALAIIDDIGAVAVIAVFYTSSIDLTALLIGLVLLGVQLTGNIAGARSPLFYLIVGVGVWYCFLLSGVHATVAGVLVAFTIPTRQRLNVREFYQKCTRLLDTLSKNTGNADASILANDEAKAIVRSIEKNCERVQPPLLRLEQSLHGFVAYIIMPIFVLANAGVMLTGDPTSVFSGDLGLGILLGLVVGKPLGIFLFSFGAAKLGLAQLPAEVRWMQLLSIGFLGGIGFTMSLFITGLAFTDTSQIADAKLTILAASVCASLLGWGFFTLANHRTRTSEGNHTIS